MEKAAAKLFANYDGLTSGMTSSALKFLTGMPVTRYSASELRQKGDDFLWNFIMKGTENKWPMTTGTAS